MTLLATALMLAAATPSLAAREDGPHFPKPSADMGLRSGPGADYGVDGTLRRGELLFVQSCQGEWCFVHRDGGEVGWATDSLLINVATPSDRNDDGSKKVIRAGDFVDASGAQDAH